LVFFHYTNLKTCDAIRPSAMFRLIQTNRSGWFVGANALYNKTYDGHMFKEALRQVNRVAREPQHAFVDMGYRSHNYRRPTEVQVDKRRRVRTAKG
jgi:IS5 family transposase